MTLSLGSWLRLRQCNNGPKNDSKTHSDKNIFPHYAIGLLESRGGIPKTLGMNSNFGCWDFV